MNAYVFSVQPCAIGHTGRRRGEIWIMGDNGDAICGAQHIQFNNLNTDRESLGETRSRILRHDAPSAPVAMDADQPIIAAKPCQM